MTGSGTSGDAEMSKRARITLNAEEDPETIPEVEATPQPETAPRTRSGFTAAADQPSESSAPATRAFGAGTIIKAVFVGVAVVTALLLWKNRRP
jgi:hypothetical protein